MGRKIPGKKHRKVVDPEKQRSRREASLKDKINKPPRNADEQEVPKSVLLLTELKKKAKLSQEQKKKTKKKKKVKKNDDKPLSVKQFLDTDKIQSGMVKPDKFIPNLVQRPQESVFGFYRRVNLMTQEIIKEVQFEDQFGVSIKKDLNTGKILNVEKNKKKSLRKKKEKTRKKSLKERRKEKKMRKMEDETKDFSHLKDKVEFGEVVHRPPINLKLSNKTAKVDTLKANKYKNLLLQDLIKNKNKTGKEPIQLEKEEKQRQFIVNAYRERKKLQKKAII